MHEITKEVVFITFKVAKIDELLLSLRCGKPCIWNEYSTYLFIERKPSKARLLRVISKAHNTSILDSKHLDTISERLQKAF